MKAFIQPNTYIAYCILLLGFLLSCSDDSGENDIPQVSLRAAFEFDEAPALFSGDEIQFTDKSTGSPTSWNWTFEGGTPATSTEQNPKVIFNQGGNLSVSLRISNGESEKSQRQVLEIINISVPPYDGTIWPEPGIIIDSDPSTFSAISYKGQEERIMYDRRIANWERFNAHVYEATYENGQKVDIQVNPEFSESQAKAYAEEYAEYVGVIPAFLMIDVKTVSIHDGNEPFGGGSNDILVHVQQGEEYLRVGNMIETLIHEAAHVSLDQYIYQDPAWTAAVEADPTFISTYARDNPRREDGAESILLYLAVKCKSDRITEKMKAIIEKAIPNRIKYFDAQNYDLSPLD
ncbi:MAG: PKD domain-containing protein [Bacteroidota bacterium]